MNTDLFKKIYFSDSLVGFLASFSDMVEDKNPSTDFYIFVSSHLDELRDNIDEMYLYGEEHILHPYKDGDK